MNDDKNKKKVVVITGVTRGLGRAMAEKFVSLGHTVLGCGRSRGLVDELRHRWPKRHAWDIVDVTSDGQVQDWMARLHKKCGAPDLVINNAGIINRNAPLWRVSERDFSALVVVDLPHVHPTELGRDNVDRGKPQEQKCEWQGTADADSVDRLDD